MARMPEAAPRLAAATNQQAVRLQAAIVNLAVVDAAEVEADSAVSVAVVAAVVDAVTAVVPRAIVLVPVLRLLLLLAEIRRTSLRLCTRALLARRARSGDCGRGWMSAC